MNADARDASVFAPMSNVEIGALDRAMQTKEGAGAVFGLVGAVLARFGCTTPPGSVRINARGAINYAPPIVYGIAIEPRVLHNITREGASDDERRIARAVFEVALSEIRTGLAAHLRQIASQLDPATNGASPSPSPSPSLIILPGRG